MPTTFWGRRGMGSQARPFRHSTVWKAIVQTQVRKLSPGTRRLGQVRQEVQEGPTEQTTQIEDTLRLQRRLQHRHPLTCPETQGTAQEQIIAAGRLISSLLRP